MILGGTANYVKSGPETKIRNFWRWSGQTQQTWAHEENRSVRFEWATDSDGYTGGTIDPEGLGASGWGIESCGPVIGYGEEHGRYYEAYLFGQDIFVIH